MKDKNQYETFKIGFFP